MPEPEVLAPGTWKLALTGTRADLTKRAIEFFEAEAKAAPDHAEEIAQKGSIVLELVAECDDLGHGLKLTANSAGWGEPVTSVCVPAPPPPRKP